MSRSWVFPDMARDTAEGVLLAASSQEGTYMVRQRAGFAQDYVLAVIYKGKPTHHLVTYGDDGQYSVNRKSFGDHKTIEDVIETLSGSAPGWPVPLSTRVDPPNSQALQPADVVISTRQDSASVEDEAAQQEAEKAERARKTAERRAQMQKEQEEEEAEQLRQQQEQQRARKHQAEEQKKREQQEARARQQAEDDERQERARQQYEAKQRQQAAAAAAAAAAPAPTRGRSALSLETKIYRSTDTDVDTDTGYLNVDSSATSKSMVSNSGRATARAVLALNERVSLLERTLADVLLKIQEFQDEQSRSSRF